MNMQWPSSAPAERVHDTRGVSCAPTGRRVYCMMLTNRGQERRVISLRNANHGMARRYAG